MIEIKNFNQLGLFVTWRLLYIALCEKQLQEEDVIKYAIKQLEEGDDRSEVCELAGAYADEHEHIQNLLWELISQENTQNELERRKLRAVIVDKALRIKNDNYINGLIDLATLWCGLRYPSDSPHIIQGKNNNITPKEYYAVGNYDILYEKNAKWLKTELEYLRANQ